MSREARQILMNPSGYTRTSLIVAEQAIDLERKLDDAYELLDMIRQSGCINFDLDEVLQKFFENL